MRNRLLFLLFLIVIGCSSSQTYQAVYDSSADKNELLTNYQAKYESGHASKKELLILSYIYYKQEKFAEAIRILNGLASDYPFESDIYILQGQVEYSTGNYESARQSFSAAALYDNNNLQAHYGLALAYYKIGDYNLADQANNAALNLDPLFFDARLLNLQIQSDATDRQVNSSEILRKIDLLERANPSSLDVLKLKLKNFAEQGQLQNVSIAINNFGLKYPLPDEILEIQCLNELKLGRLDIAKQLTGLMNSGKVYAWRCNIATLMAEEKYAQALDTYYSNRYLFNQDLNSRLIEAEILLELKQTTKAISILENIYFDNYYNDPKLNYTLAKAYYDQQEYDKATNYLNKALTSDNNYIDAIRLQIEIQLKTGDIDAAEKNFYSKNFANLDPQILETQADIFLAQNNISQAQRFYSAAQDIYYRTSVQLKLAMIEFSNHRIDQATNIILDVLKINPKNLQAIIMLGRIYYVTTKYSACSSLFNTVKDPSLVQDVGLTFALCLLKLNQTNRGIDLLLKTANNFNNSAVLIDVLSKSLMDNKRYNEAIPYLEQIVAINPRESNYLNARLSELYRLVKDQNRAIDSSWHYLTK